ncbi:hypothetical protein ALC57_18462, partial [Trachymyrmex cornetzi]
IRTDEESRRTSLASFSVQTLTHFVNITSLLVETLPRFERQRQFVSAMVSQGDLHVTRRANVDYNFQIFITRSRQIVTVANDFMSSHTASKISMCMRSRSSSRSRFHNHVRFSRPLTYTINTDVSYNEFCALCCDCWQQKYGFVVIDKDSALKDGRYRK